MSKCKWEEERKGKCQSFICPEIANISEYCNKHEKRKCVICKDDAEPEYKICMKHYDQCKYCYMSKFNYYCESE